MLQAQWTSIGSDANILCQELSGMGRRLCTVSKKNPETPWRKCINTTGKNKIFNFQQIFIFIYLRYPTPDEKRQLAKKTGLTLTQVLIYIYIYFIVYTGESYKIFNYKVSNWFKNRRQRDRTPGRGWVDWVVSFMILKTLAGVIFLSCFLHLSLELKLRSKIPNASNWWFYPRPALTFNELHMKVS